MKFLEVVREKEERIELEMKSVERSWNPKILKKERNDNSDLTKKNGQNKDTEKSIRIKISKKQTRGTTQNKMVQSGTARHREERKKPARNIKKNL
jgi:hypothetical protein